MAGDEVSTDVVVARLDALKETVDHLRADLVEQGKRYVPREVFDGFVLALGDWKVERGIDIADLGAEQARVKRELDERRHEWERKIQAVRDERIAGQRWAVTVAVAAAGVVAGVVATLINTLGLGA